MEMFDELLLWMDLRKRPGPEAMAVDEWLLENTEKPVLRIYGWDGDWGSVGYFGKIADARASIPGVRWVRRWTGGGLVDHRADWTYTLVVPKAEKLANAKGAESYRWIHLLLGEALESEGAAAELCSGNEMTGSTLCFENPVCHDLIGKSGLKLAGAGQRRTRFGLLHQGSVALPCDHQVSCNRATRLAELLAKSCRQIHFEPAHLALETMISNRYSDARWTELR